MKTCIFNKYIDGEDKECESNYNCKDCIIGHDIKCLVGEILSEKQESQQT